MLSLKIALRFLSSSRMQTVMLILAIAVGVSVQIFVGVLIQSLQATLVNRTLGSSPHITVIPGENATSFGDWEGMIVVIEDEVPLALHVSAVADASALANTPSNRTFPCQMRGLQMDRSMGIYNLGDKMVEGTLPATGQVIAGVDNRDKYGLTIGSTLDIVLPNGTRAPVTISGFFDLGVEAVNQRWLVAPLATVQSMFGLGNNVTSIEMQVDDVFGADVVAGDVEAAVAGKGVQVSDWKAENAQLLSGLSAQGSSSYMIQFFVMGSVVIAIASVLAITVTQKSRQLGILKAMGITDQSASAIFMFQGLILGLGGSIAGVALGMVLFLGFQAGTGTVDTYINWLFILGSGAVAVLAATGASLIPARKSARLDPIEVIRNG